MSRKNGTIYFTDASDKFPVKDYLLDMIEARPHGRLMRYDPVSGKVTVLLSGLHFANGVALSKERGFCAGERNLYLQYTPLLARRA